MTDKSTIVELENILIKLEDIDQDRFKELLLELRDFPSLSSYKKQDILTQLYEITIKFSTIIGSIDTFGLEESIADNIKTLQKITQKTIFNISRNPTEFVQLYGNSSREVLLSINDYEEFFELLEEIKSNLQSEIDNIKDTLNEIDSDEVYHEAEETVNKNIFTCGVTWGQDGANYKDIILDKNIAILASDFSGSNTFRAIKSGDLIVIKEGTKITYIGEAIDRATQKKWSFLISENEYEKYVDGKYNIDILPVLFWMPIDPPIIYKTQQACVKIQQPNIINQINKYYEKKVNEYSNELLRKLVKQTNPVFVEDILQQKELIHKWVDKIGVLKSQAEQLVGKISEKAVEHENEKLATYFKLKVTDLKTELKGFENWFKWILIINIVFIIIMIVIQALMTDLAIEIRIFLSVSMVSVSLILFWLARYYNRRMHETIQLKEEYEHKELVLNSSAAYSINLQGYDKELQHDFVKKISEIITHSPASNMNKKKIDPTPIDDLEKIVHMVTQVKDLKDKPE